MNEMKFTRVTSDNGDWEAWYANKQLIYDGHGARPQDILEALGASVNTINLSDHAMEKLAQNFPKQLPESPTIEAYAAVMDLEVYSEQEAKDAFFSTPEVGNE